MMATRTGVRQATIRFHGPLLSRCPKTLISIPSRVLLFRESIKYASCWRPDCDIEILFEDKEHYYRSMHYLSMHFTFFDLVTGNRCRYSSGTVLIDTKPDQALRSLRTIKHLISILE